MKRHYVCIVWFAASLFNPNVALGQCFNSAQPSCEVYKACFSTLCDCGSSPHEYFLSYGQKYCTTFLDLPGMSDKGKQWRDSTLRCLQEDLVPKLPAFGKAAECNCASTQTIAFDSHVSCYTKPWDSICSLPLSDWRLIVRAVDPINNLQDRLSRKQMLEVAKICVAQVAGETKKVVQEIIEKMK